MPDTSPSMRCSHCRGWIYCIPSNTTLPAHNYVPFKGSPKVRCPGSGKAPAQRRGKFD